MSLYSSTRTVVVCPTSKKSFGFNPQSKLYCSGGMYPSWSDTLVPNLEKMWCYRNSMLLNSKSAVHFCLLYIILNITCIRTANIYQQKIGSFFISCHFFTMDIGKSLICSRVGIPFWYPRMSATSLPTNITSPFTVYTLFQANFAV